MTPNMYRNESLSHVPIWGAPHQFDQVLRHQPKDKQVALMFSIGSMSKACCSLKANRLGAQGNLDHKNQRQPHLNSDFSNTAHMRCQPDLTSSNKASVKELT